MAHRFSVGIRNKYPYADLHVFSDTENNFLQRDVLNYLYKDFYSSITVIPNKKYKKCIINSQFGEEEYLGNINNVPDNIKDRMVNDCDRFYSLHLDSLAFLDHDYDWVDCFYKFPKPEINPPNNIGNYLISHLISSTSLEHRLNTDFYVTRLVKDIDKLCKEFNWQHIIISQENFNKYYEEALKTCTNSQILNTDIKGVCDKIVNAKLMISVDSGFRPVAYPLMPVISFSKQCSAPNQMNLSHILRWNPIKPYFPLNWNTGDIIKTARKLLENKIYYLFPELCLTNQELSSILIKRDYKVNLEKSILNN